MRHAPPLRIRNDTVAVRVHVRKECVQFSAGDRHVGVGKCGFEFVLVDYSIVITIDGLEKLP